MKYRTLITKYGTSSDIIELSYKYHKGSSKQMEGNTYSASWRKQGNNFLVYLKDEPTMKSSDMSFDVACNDLCLEICKKYGDGEAILNFLKQAPIAEGVAKYSNPALVTLGWNDSAYGESFQGGLFEGGYCSACKGGVGLRTTTPLVIKTFPTGNIGDFNQIMFSPVLLSEEFVSLLSEKEKAQLKLQKVLSSKKTNKMFYEVTGQPHLKQIGIKGASYNQLVSWQCQKCKCKSFSCTHPELPNNYKYTDFCCISDLPANIDEVFVIEDNIGRLMECMSLRRWKQLSKDANKTKGILTDRLFVLPEEQIEREPIVRIEKKAN